MCTYHVFICESSIKSSLADISSAFPSLKNEGMVKPFVLKYQFKKSTDSELLVVEITAQMFVFAVYTVPNMTVCLGKE